MSIINEALKKAEEEKNINIQEEKPLSSPEEKTTFKEKPQSPPRIDNRIKDSGKASKKISILPYILYIVAFGVFTFLTVYIISNQKPQGETQYVPPEQKVSIEKQPSANPLTSSSQIPLLNDLKTAPQAPEFVVTGIVHGNGPPMAVINGAVYVSGETVKSAKILEISEEMVVLERKGKRIELKVK